MNFEERIRRIVRNVEFPPIVGNKRHYMSRQHFRAASYFAAEVSRLESEFRPPQSDSELMAKHRAYVTSAVFSAVACLEASINEFYLDCVYLDKSVHQLEGLLDSHREHLADWWPMLDKRKADILLKYQHALRIVGAEAFEAGKRPYQDVDGLIQLRNLLTHFTPEMDNNPNAKHLKIRARLRGQFTENPYAVPEPQETLWFPHLCLGSGCANWAVEYTKLFLDQFSEALGIPNRI